MIASHDVSRDRVRLAGKRRRLQPAGQLVFTKPGFTHTTRKPSSRAFVIEALEVIRESGLAAPYRTTGFRPRGSPATELSTHSVPPRARDASAALPQKTMVFVKLTSSR